MKKYIVIIPIVLLTVTLCSAQNVTDVIRYGLENSQGSARYQALSGAFGALGGDLSAIGINPAGSAVFNNSKMTTSTTGYIFDNTTSYFDNEENLNDYNISMNQVGGVFVFRAKKKNKGWKKISFSLNYDVNNNYNNEFISSGASPNSIDQYFLTFATGRNFGQILPEPGQSLAQAYANIGSQYGFSHQQAFLGYQTFIIDAADDSDPNNIIYSSNTGSPDVLKNHRYQSISEGNSSKFTANLAAQVSNIYFGASVNYHTIQYNRITLFDETGYDPATSPMQFLRFDNLFRTTGNAFSFAAGIITKIKDRFRVGVSYQSPIRYTLTDELSQSISSNLSFPDLATIDFSIVNVFPEYEMQIPAKVTGSLAVVFGKHGLVSFDYDRQDFSKALLRPISDFDTENTLINNRLKAVSTFRIGGEYRLEGLSLRGGYRIQGSPYENDIDVGDLQGYSLGLGYDFGGTQIDVSYNKYQRESTPRLFDVGFSNTTQVDARNTNITLSLTFNL